MILPVITYPDPILEQKSKKAVFNQELETLIQNMLDTVNSYKDPQAAGLSAIQIGIPLQVLIARDFVYGDKQTEVIGTNDYILINPKFVSLSKEEELDWEGCLSFPDLYGKVLRSKKIKLKYQDSRGLEQRVSASGFLARVIQHEMDHLNGITFNTRIVGKMYKGAELDAGTKIVD